MKINSLMCENSINPIGIDISKPLLSWKIISTKRGAKQTAYRIQVAHNPFDLESEKKISLGYEQN